MTVKLSVCVTTYNRAELLDRTFRSLASQTRQPDELIVSDDCSTDSTLEVVEQWRHSFPGFKFNRNARNLYMPGNLNAAVRLASGEYVANLHDGDEYDPTLLEKWERALDAHPSAGFVFCGCATWPHPPRLPNGSLLDDVPPLTPGRLFFERHFLHSFFSIVWGTVLARHSAYDELLPFDATYGFISDVDMWMRMCLKYDVAYVREPLMILDVSPTKDRKFSWERIETTRKMQLANIHRFFCDHPDRLRKEIIQHRRTVHRYYLRRILGRIYHRDWKAVSDGIGLYMLEIGRMVRSG